MREHVLTPQDESEHLVLGPVVTARRKFIYHTSMPDKIKIGVSSCLLGNRTRWDGAHARDAFIAEVLGRKVVYVPVCPEVECGFGVPRNTMRLEGDPEAPSLVMPRTGADHTARMHAWARQRVQSLEQEALRGFIFKEKSPSCGMKRVKVFDEENRPVPGGVGLFAREVMARFPLLPVEEDGRLRDPRIRAAFLRRIFAASTDVVTGPPAFPPETG